MGSQDCFTLANGCTDADSVWIGEACARQLATTNADFEMVQRLSARHRNENDAFGTSVAMHGTSAVIGAYQYDTIIGTDTMNGAGLAEFWEKDASTGTWKRQQIVISPEPNGSDQFGIDASIYGDYAVIGSWRDDHDLNGTNYLLNSGSAAVFKRDASGHWVYHQKLVAEYREAGAIFGRSVAMWDNFSTHHYAVADYYPQRRVMRRITVAGREPGRYVPREAVAA